VLVSHKFPTLTKSYQRKKPKKAIESTKQTNKPTKKEENKKSQLHLELSSGAPLLQVTDTSSFFF